MALASASSGRLAAAAEQGPPAAVGVDAVGSWDRRLVTSPANTKTFVAAGLTGGERKRPSPSRRPRQFSDRGFRERSAPRGSLSPESPGLCHAVSPGSVLARRKRHEAAAAGGAQCWPWRGLQRRVPSPAPDTCVRAEKTGLCVSDSIPRGPNKGSSKITF